MKHGEADAKNIEAWVHNAQAVESFEQFRNRADSEGFCLLRNDDRIGGGDDVIGDSEEAGRGVD